MSALSPTLPGVSVMMEPGCIRLRAPGAELRLAPLAVHGPAELRTRLFAVTHRTHEKQLDANMVAGVRDATLAWETAMGAVAPALEEMPGMHAIHLLCLHLSGASLDEQARATRQVIEGSGSRNATWRDVPLLTYRQRAPLPGDVRAQVRWICRRPPATLAGGQHVIVAGTGRSGTRWAVECVSRLLSLTSPPVTISNPLVGQKTGGTHDDLGWVELISRCNAYFPASDAQQVENALADIDALRSVALVCPAGVRIVTKTDRSLPAWRWAAAFRGARVLRVQRDPRNVFLSRRQFQRASGPRGPALAVFLTKFFARALTRRAFARWGPDQLVMRYEDMLADLPGQLQRLSESLGIALSPAVCESTAHELTFDAMAGRRYGQLRDGDYFRGGSDWTRELDATERVVAGLFDPLVTRLGYPPAAQ